jgi:hypothetical protein
MPTIHVSYNAALGDKCYTASFKGFAPWACGADLTEACSRLLRRPVDLGGIVHCNITRATSGHNEFDIEFPDPPEEPRSVSEPDLTAEVWARANRANELANTLCDRNKQLRGVLRYLARQGLVQLREGAAAQAPHWAAPGPNGQECRGDTPLKAVMEALRRYDQDEASLCKTFDTMGIRSPLA